MELEEIAAGLSLTGVESDQIVTDVATVPGGGGALQLIYRTPNGSMKERLIGRADRDSISVATVKRPFSFDGSGEAFQLACEAKRIDLAFLFDPMMAVHTSNVEPLPQPITAVYDLSEHTLDSPAIPLNCPPHRVVSPMEHLVRFTCQQVLRNSSRMMEWKGCY